MGLIPLDRIHEVSQRFPLSITPEVLAENIRHALHVKRRVCSTERQRRSYLWAPAGGILCYLSLIIIHLARPTATTCITRPRGEAGQWFEGTWRLWASQSYEAEKLLHAASRHA